MLIGVFCSTAFSLGNLVMIYHALPALLLQSPSSPLLLQQWQLLLHRGHYLFPGSAILAASAFFVAGRRMSSAQTLYFAAAALNLAVIPFTLIFVAPVNVELLQRAARARKGIAEVKRSAETGFRALDDGELIGWWGTLGAIRAVFPLGGIVMAMAGAGFESTVGGGGVLSTESVSLALGTAVFIFMVVRFGLPVVQV
jgi:hypothetical protein